MSVAEEPPLDPGRPIIDPHLHLWEIQAAPGSMQAPQRFLLHEAVGTIAASGHNLTHTVFVECHAMYRRDGPEAMRALGQTEFANGAAAMSDSGGYGPCRIAHRIVGRVELSLGEAAEPVLERHLAVAGERFRGVRCDTAFSRAGMFGGACDPAAETLLLDNRFRAGARVLARLGLSLDVWCFHTQLGQLIALADALPELTLILDHLGTPESLGAYADRQAEAFAEWRASLAELARRPNVLVKLGGLGMDVTGALGRKPGTDASKVLAERWRPLIETGIERFGPARCMFESNFPPDRDAGTYGATWNAFKRITAAASDGDKDLLFRRTAAAAYRIALD